MGPVVSTPLVSVLIITHNYAHYLKKCLNSVLEQTYKQIEIIVLDDGSTDNTAEIVKAYQKNNENIFYHYQEKQKTGKWNFGVAQSCNYALSLARGEYVCFLAADDRFVPERVEIQVKAFVALREKQPELALIHSNTVQEIIDEEALSLAPGAPQDVLLNFKKNGYVRWVREHRKGIANHNECVLISQDVAHHNINGGTVMCKKAVVDELGGFRSKYPLACDYDMWFRILLEGYSAHYIDLPLQIYLIQPTNSKRFDDAAEQSGHVIKDLWKTYSIERLVPLLQKEQTPKNYARAYEILGDYFMAKKTLFDEAIECYERSMDYLKSSEVCLKLDKAYSQKDSLQTRSYPSKILEKKKIYLENNRELQWLKECLKQDGACLVESVENDSINILTLSHWKESSIALNNSSFILIDSTFTQLSNEKSIPHELWFQFREQRNYFKGEKHAVLPLTSCCLSVDLENNSLIIDGIKEHNMLLFFDLDKEDVFYKFLELYFKTFDHQSPQLLLIVAEDKDFNSLEKQLIIFIEKKGLDLESSPELLLFKKPERREEWEQLYAKCQIYIDLNQNLDYLSEQQVCALYFGCWSLGFYPSTATTLHVPIKTSPLEFAHQLQKLFSQPVSSEKKKAYYQLYNRQLQYQKLLEKLSLVIE